jgi:preprotein translocase subunit YajC
MKTSELIMQFIRQYFIIFGLLVISLVVFTSPERINRDYILLAMAFAALGDLPVFVFWSRSELNEKSMRLRTVIHFILLEAIILTFGGIVGVVSNLRGYFSFGIEIAVIYALVKFISWRGDRKTADKINEKLKSLKNVEEEE